MKLQQRQQGVALITAVLIVALVTTVAVAMASRQQFDVRRAGNIFNSDQTWLAVLGGEDYARNILAVDEKLDVDHLEEIWAQPAVFPFEGMTLSGQLEDMQGRFNINNLVENGAVNQADVDRFERLLTILELDTSLSQAVVDWLDEDFETRPDGAEDDYYMLQDPPYRAANRLMASPSELLLVKGVDKEVYQTLQPFVSTLPKRTALNVNTASAELLATIDVGLEVADGEGLIEFRGEDGFSSVANFLGQALLKDRNINQNDLSVKTEHFLLGGMAEFDDANSRLFSLLSRDDKGQVSVLMRSRGAY